MPALAFLPWLRLEEPLTVGPLRLLPYHRGKVPNDLPYITQVELDGILGAYANRPRSKVRDCVILEFGDWYAGMDISEEQAAELFKVRHLMGFAALARRELYGFGGNYTNFDAYALVIQRYRSGDTGSFAFVTRRRDGGTHQMWSTNEFAFFRPSHVDDRAHLSIDEPLLRSLLALPASHGHLIEAVEEFNLANSDSPDVPVHIEAVMSKSAFEWLLGIDQNSKTLVSALRKRLSGLDIRSYEGPLKQAWFTRWPRSECILEAWAKDFCAIRGTSAHGMSGSRFVWDHHQHLAFIAVFFPLLLRKVLADEALFALPDRDVEHLKHIEGYLVHNPFGHDYHSRGEHPWSAVASNAMRAIWAAKLYAVNNES